MKWALPMGEIGQRYSEDDMVAWAGFTHSACHTKWDKLDYIQKVEIEYRRGLYVPDKFYPGVWTIDTWWYHR
mgnify:CR=1 FL=1